MDGIINVYKEQGFTSHDVVAKLRGILHMKKIGHTGTLDPDAVGVLPVCLGKGTKVCELITDWNKTYEAVMLLGTTTDTQDTSGSVLEVKEVDVDERKLVEVIASFEGEYDQIPPMYSALKVDGKKLYELAREGKVVERKARKVKIESIRINEMNLEDEQKTVTFTVTCSKGTYVRTLCHDIGELLGCGACMQHLTRTRVGQFNVDDSLTLNQVAALVLKGEFAEKLVSVDSLFNYEHITVGEEHNKLLYNGNALPVLSVMTQEQAAYADGEKFCVYDAKGEFIGIYQCDRDVLKLIKMFYTGINDEV